MAVPYAGALGGRDALGVIEETAGRLGRVLEGVSVEAADVPLAPGNWSLREVMAHLADCEIAWGWRLRQVLAEDGPVLQPFDQDKWAQVYGGYSLAEAWACWKGLRAWNVALVRGLSEAEKERGYVHPERGEETLWTVVEIMAGHDLHHLEGLEGGA